MADREAPAEQGRLLLAPSTGSGRQNVSPAVSPDGRFVAFLSEKDLFSVDLYMADAETGDIIRKLSSANSDPHSDALRYIDSSGTWSPDGEYFAFIVTAAGGTEIVIVESNDGTEYQRIVLEDIGAVIQPAWSPDGRFIAFSGSVGGISDLYSYDLESGSVIRHTNDKYGDFQPAWSPDGRTIAFASDRGPETDFERLTTSEFQLSLLDVPTGRVTWLPVFGNVKHMNPQYAPDGQSLYFLSDQDGVNDIYELDFEAGDVRRITRLATAVSGITYMSPAITVAANTGRIIYSVFDEREFHIYAANPEAGEPATIVADAHAQPGRKLTPANPQRFSRVSTYLSDPVTGLVTSGTYTTEDAEEYDSGLSLDFVGQPTVGVGVDNFGTSLYGGVYAYFSDMLGDRGLGVAISAQGSFKDIGGQLFYQNLDHRWNYAASVGRSPYIFGAYGYGQEANGQPFFAQTKYRMFVTAASGQVAYPFSQSLRFELGGGVTRYSYDIEVNKYTTDIYGRIGEQYARETLEAPSALNLTSGSFALVGDNAIFGFVSPIQGGRYRFGLEQTFGTVDYTTITADWRRYFAPHRNLTVGFRGMHYGRYGLTVEENLEDGFGILLRPLFLGYETYIRGYSYESFEANECVVSQQDVFQGGNSCGAFDRLFGNQLAVANFELRIPFIGVEQYGIINFPFMPTELVLFADAGLAWDELRTPTLEWSRDGNDRVPLVSTGVSARVNILGFMILETYYAFPWQRPEKGWHWGFNLAPGW
jgi:dipeptidyl aminopeptidase/acylaminoacyl peptidase